MNRSFTFKVGIRINSRLPKKAKGGGFQCDALCSNGCTYCFHFRNKPPPSKYVKEGLSPLHARVMGMFDSLDDQFHHCGMDNLYSSAIFFAARARTRKSIVPWCCTKRWSWSTFLCCSRGGTEQEGAREGLWNSKGSRDGW